MKTKYRCYNLKTKRRKRKEKKNDLVNLKKIKQMVIGSVSWCKIGGAFFHHELEFRYDMVIDYDKTILIYL